MDDVERLLDELDSVCEEGGRSPRLPMSTGMLATRPRAGPLLLAASGCWHCVSRHATAGSTSTCSRTSTGLSASRRRARPPRRPCTCTRRSASSSARPPPRSASASGSRSRSTSSGSSGSWGSEPTSSTSRGFHSETTVRPTDDGYVVDGSKYFCTMAGVARRGDGLLRGRRRGRRARARSPTDPLRVRRRPRPRRGGDRGVGPRGHARDREPGGEVPRLPRRR